MSTTGLHPIEKLRMHCRSPVGILAQAPTPIKAADRQAGGARMHVAQVGTVWPCLRR